MNIVLKALLSGYIFMYRLTSGAIGGRMAGLNVLLLTTTGRKTGKSRTTPLGYFRDDSNFVIIASNAGSEKNPGWFYNLKSNPQVNIQIGKKELTARAQVADPEKRSQLWLELVRMSPRYEIYEKQTKREIPLIILQPVQG